MIESKESKQRFGLSMAMGHIQRDIFVASYQTLEMILCYKWYRHLHNIIIILNLTLLRC